MGAASTHRWQVPPLGGNRLEDGRRRRGLSTNFSASPTNVFKDTAQHSPHIPYNVGGPQRTGRAAIEDRVGVPSGLSGYTGVCRHPASPKVCFIAAIVTPSGQGAEGLPSGWWSECACAHCSEGSPATSAPVPTSHSYTRSRQRQHRESSWGCGFQTPQTTSSQSEVDFCITTQCTHTDPHTLGFEEVVGPGGVTSSRLWQSPEGRACWFGTGWLGR